MISQDIDVGGLSEKELVRKLAAHHDFDIKFAVFTQKIEAKSGLLKLLACKDGDLKREVESQEQKKSVSDSYSNSQNQQNQQKGFRPWVNYNNRFGGNQKRVDEKPAVPRNEGNFATQMSQNNSFPSTPTLPKGGQNKPSFQGNGTKPKEKNGIYMLDRQICEDPAGACGLIADN